RPKTAIKLEAVSSRLKQTLVHPARTDHVLDPQFSPDGERIVAYGYPSGIVQVWQISTGRQLVRIESDAGKWNNWAVAGDWSRVYVSQNHSKTSAVEAGGKSRQRKDYESDV